MQLHLQILINISIFVIGTLFINILSGVSNHPDFASPAPASLLESCNNIVRSAIILITSITTGKYKTKNIIPKTPFNKCPIPVPISPKKSLIGFV